MTSRPPSPKRPITNAQLRYLLVAWISLTVIVGGLVFVLVFWAIGGFVRPGTPVAKTTQVPTAPPPTGQVPTSAVACNFPTEPASGFWYGIQSHVFGGGDNSYFMGVVNNLGLQWIKAQVRWQDLELTQGDINWGPLDTVMDTACDKGLHVLLSVVTAPDWTRANALGMEAPPDDPRAFAEFVGKLVDRYPGRIGAIEVWNEQNLEREWNTPAGISPTDYIRLLQLTHETVKSKDPNLAVISGALSPTGITCRVGPFPENCAADGRYIIMDDATYLSEFVKLGGLNYADCVGTHSNGTNLPPSADGASPPADRTGFTFTGPWDNPHYSWSLASQIDTYWEITDGAKPLCVTEFGYASPVNGVFRPGFEFAADVTEEEQGLYLVEAYNLMRDSGKVRGAWLFNLDYGPLGGDPSEDDNPLFSLLYRDGTPRPAFGMIGSMAKP